VVVSTDQRRFELRPSGIGFIFIIE